MHPMTPLVLRKVIVYTINLLFLSSVKVFHHYEDYLTAATKINGKSISSCDIGIYFT
jgi:hypothetical protein